MATIAISGISGPLFSEFPGNDIRQHHHQTGRESIREQTLLSNIAGIPQDC
jgi:hypothetical protein